MTIDLDLDAYFERIRWGNPNRPTYDTLAGLLSAHMACIPFENLDVLLGRTIRLDLEGLQLKLVQNHRGGYCFEHATLFAAVLEKLGFQPVRHSARVVLFVPRVAAPRTHMFLTVGLDGGNFVIDPGFGALAPRVPVPVAEDALLYSEDEKHWLAKDGQYWVLRARTGEKVIDCWASTLERENLVDFDMGNHFTATYPASPFVNRIMMRAFTEQGRITVMNRDVTTWHGDESHSAQLSDRVALRTLLFEHFGFDLPEVESLCVPAIPEWR